jgi:surface protein
MVQTKYSKMVLGMSIVATLMLGGCGDSTLNDQALSLKQPHKKINRDVKDWTWDVGAEASVKQGDFTFTSTYYSGMPDLVKHTQLFLDTTPNKGFNGTNGWEVFGADYLIEDGGLYKSQSDSEWKWEYIGSARAITSGSGHDKHTVFTENSILAKAINTKKINAYLEVYDKDWNGAYTTIDLSNTDVLSSEVVIAPQPDDSHDYNAGEAITRKELRRLIIAYGDDASAENKRAIEQANVSQITDMHYIFDVVGYCDAGHRFDGDISGWDTSHVINMEKMFSGSDIKVLPDSFSTTKATNMKNMFYRSEITALPANFYIPQGTKINGIFSGRSFKISDDFDTSHLSNLDGLFSYYLGESIPDIDTTNATSMKDMFLHAKVKKLPAHFNTAKVRDMSGMFAGSVMTSLPSDFDTSRVNDMEGMFAYSALTALPSDFDTANVTNMENMFLYSKITQLPDNFNTSKVTDMSSIFESSMITALPRGFDTSHVTDMRWMFANSKITTLPENFSTSNATNMGAMFSGSAITSLPNNFDTSNVTNMSSMFSIYAVGSIEGFGADHFVDCLIERLPDSFDTSSVTDMTKMFYKSKNFNQDISAWDVRNSKNWSKFNKGSSLNDAHIPSKFRDN